MLVVGLTGNYGMGKSRILSLFAKLGAFTLNSDKIVESLLSQTDVRDKIRNLLGDDAFYKNGSINKKVVAELIFNNGILRRSLEDIIHPLVLERIQLILKDKKTENKVAVVEVPLLFERGYETGFDRTVTVFTAPETAIGRLKKKGIKRRDALLRMASQLPVEEKIKRSDFVIDNNGPIKETEKKVHLLYEKLLHEAEHDYNQRP
jgi:dephospho-CoA kinase